MTQHDGADRRLEGREVEIALGSAGSNRLRSAILQVIRYVVDYGCPSVEAVRRGRMHYEGGVLHVEPGFAEAALDELERRGYGCCGGRDSTCSSAARRPFIAIPETGELSRRRRSAPSGAA